MTDKVKGVGTGFAAFDQHFQGGFKRGQIVLIGSGVRREGAAIFSHVLAKAVADRENVKPK